MEGRPGGGREPAQRGSKEHDPVGAARERIEALQHPGDAEVEELRLVQVGDLEIDAPFPQALLHETGPCWRWEPLANPWSHRWRMPLFYPAGEAAVLDRAPR